MSMWKRLSRAVSSNLERFRDDPLGTIKRDIASFNADVETLREQLELLEADHARLVSEEEQLGNKIRAALKEGQRDRGLDLAQTLSEVRQDKQRVERNLESTRRVISRAEGVQANLREEEAAKPRASESGPAKDPVIVVKARETLDRLQRELGGQPAPQANSSTQAPQTSAPPASPGEKTLGAIGSPVSSSQHRPQATKTLGGGSVAYQEPHQAAPSPAPAPKSSGKTLGGPVEPVLKVEPKTAPKTSLADDLDLVDELERLAELHQAGAISADEFKVAKQKLIDGQGG